MTNKEIQSIRLIYSGKLLHDNLTLKDCIRHNTEVKNHIIHLVHSTQNLASNKSKLTPNTSRNEIEYDIENELTPNTSTSSSDSYSTTSESSSSDLETASPSTSSNANNNNNPLSDSAANMNNFSRIQNNLSRNQQQKSGGNSDQTKLTEKQQYDQILNSLTDYYQSFGIQVQSNPWYSSYLQQLALYNHM